MNFFKRLPGWLRYYGAEIIGRILGRRLFWDMEALFKAEDAILSGCKTAEEFLEQGMNDARLIESLAPLSADSVTLHIGCGIGRIEKFIAPRVKEAYGIDVSKIMAKKARKFVNLPNAKFFHTNGKDLSIFGNGFFHVIYSFLVFQHFSRSIARGYLHEVARTLRPGGFFVCQFQYKMENESVPDPPEEHPWGIRLYNVHDIRALGEGARLMVKDICNLEEARRMREQGIEHAKCNVWAIYQKTLE